MKRSSRVALCLEGLEARLNPSSQMFNDGDGDKVQFTTSKGDLPGHITQSFPNVQGVFNVDISDASFNGTNLSVFVKKAKTGDGLAIIGHINAGTNNLGSVTIRGDLGDVDAGNGSITIPAIKSLSVDSFGRFGQRGNGNSTSTINGILSSLIVKGDVHDTYVAVTRTLALAVVGGSLVGGDSTDRGEIYAYELGKVSIAHDIRGGDGDYSGSVGAGHSVGSITVGGSVIGGKGTNSGDIYAGYYADGNISKVKIGGSLVGGDGGLSGMVGGSKALGGTHNVSLGIVTIGHDIVGGQGLGDAGVWAFNGTLDRLTVKGSVIGGSGDFSGEIQADGVCGAISIGGSVYGGSGGDSARIFLGSGAGSLSVGGALLGGNGVGSAQVYVGIAPLDRLKIGHDIRGGSGGQSAEVIGTVTTVLLGGNVIPGTGLNSGKIG
jgi:hypothetical protein